MLGADCVAPLSAERTATSIGWQVLREVYDKLVVFNVCVFESYNY